MNYGDEIIFDVYKDYHIKQKYRHKVWILLLLILASIVISGYLTMYETEEGKKAVHAEFVYVGGIWAILFLIMLHRPNLFKIADVEYLKTCSSTKSEHDSFHKKEDWRYK